MIEWFGGGENALSMLIPLVGICVIVVAERVTGTNRAKRYVLPAFVLWFGLRAVIGLEQGPIVSLPPPIGLLLAVSLLVGFLSLLLYGFYVLWAGRDPIASRA
ncbi:hypothetical protein DJ83_06365 [Halorubrum ezzemoulense]|jgi:hypothetical protein|uniref:Uncharacterized protein n=2 Tax=Halorubrum ezzemoulense TaxID=337243 RepID=A0A256KDP7_HALEZ|nr:MULTISPECIES: hypothetical protein [Halorubrum]OSP10019.1 hypothetical protein B9H04_03440 [Halorubrum ezzemoulense DSM 17463]MDB2265448.1 hypothetical protein [Halorubrum ezzemoulense]MDB2269970.1 hypothetical protein [Halorubrum ezzemoulense]MDB9235198.1 hypothetical protein [Halorubrum ezzemoulense]MDB9301946.1 hypothetical protein [Halorubrum ezzemoulense]